LIPHARSYTTCPGDFQGSQVSTSLADTEYNKRLGLLLNFGAARMIDGITRVVHGLPDDG